VFLLGFILIGINMGGHVAREEVEGKLSYVDLMGIDHSEEGNIKMDLHGMTW
jgi:hypothetical protein